jgi:hypothetical protein
MRILVALALSTFTLSCGQLVLAQPDGGRALIQCDGMIFSTVSVTVVGPDEKPIPDATVQALNESSMKSFVVVTNSRGVITVPASDLGQGPVKVRASIDNTDGGTQRAAEGRITFSCGDCGCSAVPSLLVLRLP